ncbi:hypothetical protein BDB01DRAFT_836344 [Pilobolus umbonatus]|nr:hypothetical protein BDB01DRAFT_836344 [Pilobolus umbonatus]
MMAQSQPGTPRPSNKDSNYQQNTPFPSRIEMMRTRPTLFPNDTSPYFSASKPLDNLFSSDKSTVLSVRIQSKMDRGFFLTENDWTCYRRNYFQVSSVFSLHGFNHYYSPNEPQIFVQTEETVLQPVHRFLLGISARVANNDKEIELIQHTPKRDKGPQYKPEPKVISPGGNLTMSSIANNQNIVTFERVQFKTATANNGKRRAAQQYYVCIVDLYAEIENGRRVKVGSVQSAPLVVRGRSPGHYADSQGRQQNAVHITQQQHLPQLHASEESRSYVPYPKPPISQPVMSNEYSQPYQYYVGYQYPHLPQQPPMINESNPPPNHATSPASHLPLPSPYSHHQPNYIVHENNHSEPYGNEFHASSPVDQKIHPFSMQTMDSHHNNGYDWQRARYNSSSSGSSSAPSPGSQQQEQPTNGNSNYFSQQSSPVQQLPSRPFSPPPVPYPYNNAKKYNDVPNLCNKQVS